MSRGPENTFIASVHRHLPANVYSMKNHNQYNGGIADCWYSGASADLWIEYKFITVPKRADTLIDLCGGPNPPLSRLQQEWLRDRHREGRNVWVVVGCKTGGVVYQDLLWETPVLQKTFLPHVLGRMALAAHISDFCANGRKIS